MLKNNGARGFSRAESAGAAALFTTPGRSVHKVHFRTSNIPLRRYHCTLRKAALRLKWKRLQDFLKNAPDCVKAKWFSLLEHVKNAPGSVRTKLARLLEVIKTAPAIVRAKLCSFLEVIRTASDTVRAHWLYILVQKLYAFLAKSCQFFDRQYKRTITYFPLAAAGLACVYLQLPLLKYLDFLSYICQKKCLELARGYQVFWLLRMEARLKNMKIQPRDEETNKMEAVVQGAQLALKQAQEALNQAEKALEAVLKAAADAEKAAEAAAAEAAAAAAGKAAAAAAS